MMYDIKTKYRNSAKFQAIVATIWQTALLSAFLGLGAFLDGSLATFWYNWTQPAHWDGRFYATFCLLSLMVLLVIAVIIISIITGIYSIYKANLKDIVIERKVRGRKEN